jgi:hypothetical protein
VGASHPLISINIFQTFNVKTIMGLKKKRRNYMNKYLRSHVLVVG